MPNVRCGKIWKFTQGMPASMFREPDPAAPPVGGDLCTLTSGKPAQMPSTGAAATAAARTIHFICLEGRYTQDFLNNPTYVAGSPSVVGYTQIGANRAHEPDADSKLKSFMPVMEGFIWVMTASAACVVGNKYAVERVGAGDYRIDQGDPQDVVEVLGLYSVSFERDTVPLDYWVKACLPGGYK